MKGKFKVKLNRYNLNVSNLAHSIYWAGLIVHEMLHNLGHKHMSDHCQINVLFLMENISFEKKLSVT